MVSTSSAASDSARQPRGLVKLNGVRFGFTGWEVDNNTHYQPDTFRVSIPMRGQQKGYGLAWISSQTKIPVEIYAGFPADPDSYTENDLTLIFTGRADDCVISMRKRSIELSGRDRTGELIDTKTTQKYPNLTASQIATKIANNHGLAAQVTATTKKVGRYYDTDFVRMQDNRTEWDLLTFLAREEQFDCFVSANTLYFQPKGASKAPRNFVWDEGAGEVASFPGTDLDFSHNFNLAKDIVVIVNSYDPRRGQKVSKSAKATHTKSPVLKGASEATYDTQTYVYRIPNLDPDQAQARATQIALELSKHEYKVKIEGPADSDLDTQTPLAISGTGSGYDLTYWPDSIVRSMDAAGYKWTITGKNHPAESEAAL